MSRALLFLLLSATTLPLFGCGPGPSGVSGPGRVPDKPNGKDIRQRGPAETVVSAAFSPDDRFLLTGFRWEGSNKRPRRPRGLAMWDVQAGKEVWARSQEELGGEAVRFAFFPDGKRVLVRTTSAGNDRGPFALKVLDAADGSVARIYDLDAASVTLLAVAPDGKVFFKDHGGNSDIDLVDATTGKVVRSLRGGDTTRAFAVSPDGKRALSAATLPGVGCLWNVGSGEVLRKFPAADHWDRPIAFSPDGRMAAVAYVDANAPPYALVVIAADDGRTLHRLPDDGCQAVAFTADGRRLLSAGYPRLTLREVDGGKEVWSAQMAGSVAALSADAKYAFAARGQADSWQGGHIEITIWDGATGKELRTIDGGGTE